MRYPIFPEVIKSAYVLPQGKRNNGYDGYTEMVSLSA